MTVAWTRVRAILEIALDSPEDERAAVVARECGEDFALRAEVESLLVAEARSTTLARFAPLEQVDAAWSPRVALRPGMRIGQYLLRREIASGGMGTVFEAEQAQPARVVAVKTMRADLVDRDALRRFRYEAEALARLQHPNIAQVFDAGVDPVPYFAMEFVSGARSLLAHARDRELSIERRVELFLRVCDAVHYGHQRGVIHRDLKPSNILVDDRGIPKVIDYGVARVTAEDSNRSLRTLAGEVMGTMQYMGPEQLRGDPDAAEVRSDVYSLGAVLYELLCGAPLFDLKDKTLVEAVRILTTTDPRPPSAIDARVPRELDWITLKAVDRERDRRYRSVAAFASDLERFLHHEALEAGPPSGFYRARKFARRHRVGLSAIAATILSLAVGLVVALRARNEALRAEVEAIRARDATALEAARANETLTFISSIFAAVRADGGNRDAKVKDVLDAASRRIDHELANQPLVEASVRAMIGHCYVTLDDIEAAAPHVERAVELRREHLGANHPDTLRQRVALGNLRRLQGRIEDAEREFRTASTELERSIGPNDSDTLVAISSLALALDELRRSDEAESAYRKAVGIAEAHFPGTQLQASAESQFALFLFRVGEHEEAQRLIDHATSLLGSSPDASRFYTLQIRLNAASQRLNVDPTAAAADLDAIHRETAQLLGDGHFITISALAVLGRAKAAMNDRDGAIRDLERAVNDSLAAHGADAYTTIASRTELAKVLAADGRADEAESLFESAIDSANRLYGPESGDTIDLRVSFTHFLLAESRLDEAETEARSLHALSREKFGAAERTTKSAAEALARVLDARGKPEEAARIRAEHTGN